ncbi:flagellin [Mesorhizobium sp. CAU 1741]|uniref:flagellin N-terminal helical domain-containing protein n=1 Tax=Mesorhizobium sp. CAU 1741 TaxID=3140366 RepID=UPI00325A5D79
MSSINTNAAAMTALQTLRSTNMSLDTTQNRISTGFRVSEAAHNAAYWSIATTMRSDNNAMSTVRDALGLGAAQVDIAYTTMDVVKDTLDTMKAKIVAATTPDIDKSKIQEEIKQLQNDLKTYASSATFSGGNWLDVEQSDLQKVVASFLRDSTGSISLGTIEVDTAKTALFNGAADEFGLLEQGEAIEGAAFEALGADVELTATDGSDLSVDLFAHDFDGTGAGEGVIEFGEAGAVSFDVEINGEKSRITVDRALLDTLTLTTEGTISDQTELTAAINAAISEADLGDVLVADAGATASDGIVLGFNDPANPGDILVFEEDDHDAADFELTVSNVRTTSNGNFFDATSFDIANADALDLQEYMQGIDSMLSTVTTAASDLGAIKTRISSQQDFVSKIMDAVDRGVGQLVDADMEQESTKLQALQVQQQLGIQALSIANGNSQMILSLFRG